MFCPMFEISEERGVEEVGGWEWEACSRKEHKPNGEGQFRDVALQKETALHLTYLLFAQFPLCTTVHLRSSRSLPKLFGSSPCEIIANPALPTPKSDKAKRPCALFKISNEQANVPVAASHYKARQTHIRLLFYTANGTKKKNVFGLRGCVGQTGLFWQLCTTGLILYGRLFFFNAFTAITLKSIIHTLIAN